MKNATKKEPTFLELIRQPAGQTYLLGCLMMLGLAALVEMARGGIVPVLIAPLILLVGVLGIFAQFGSSPLLVLAIVAAGEFNAPRRFRGQPGQFIATFDPLDVLLCVAIVGYLICLFRLNALSVNLFPRDPRQRRQPSPRKPLAFAQRRQLLFRRAPHTFVPTEALLALMALLASCLLAVCLGLRLAQPPIVFELPSWLVRGLLLIWGVFILTILAVILFGYWRWCTWSEEEALMVLQDVYWRETRREQSRVHRWLAWAKKRKVQP